MKSPINHPQVSRPLTLAGLFASSLAYAVWLSTPTGRRWADDQTWATVVAGVALTSAWMALEEPRSLERNLWYFGVSGTPVIIRSLWLQLNQIANIMDREID